MSLQAGTIVFDIKGDATNLQNALQQAKGAFSGFANAAGMAMTAVGASITGFAISSILDFASVGDALDEMAGRTGFGTDALQELGYAATQGGGSLEDIEKAAKKLSTVIFEAGEESKAAAEKQAAAWAKGSTETIAATGAYTDTLTYLGLTYEQLGALKPEEQFKTVAFALGNVEDATARAALAQQFFGRAGTMLLPMLEGGRAGFEAMAKELHELGGAIDQDAIKKSAEFDKQLNQLKAGLVGVKLAIGETLIPSLIDLMRAAVDNIKLFAAWRKENPELTDSLIKVVVGVGMVMSVLGPLIMMLPGLVTGWGLVKGAVVAVSGVFTALAAAIGWPVTAVVAAVAALIGAALALWTYWDQVKTGLIAVWQTISNAWWAIWGPIIEAVKWLANAGISNANAVLGTNIGQFRAANSDGGGGLQQARGGNSEGGAGGIGGHVFNMTFNLSGVNDAATTSRAIAENLRLELSARGI